MELLRSKATVKDPMILYFTLLLITEVVKIKSQSQNGCLSLPDLASGGGCCDSFIILNCRVENININGASTYCYCDKGCYKSGDCCDDILEIGCNGTTTSPIGIKPLTSSYIQQTIKPTCIIDGPPSSALVLSMSIMGSVLFLLIIMLVVAFFIIGILIKRSGASNTKQSCKDDAGFHSKVQDQQCIEMQQDYAHQRASITPNMTDELVLMAGPVYDTPQIQGGTESKIELKDNRCYGDIPMKLTDNVAYGSRC